jgi:hypothetical protein
MSRADLDAQRALAEALDQVEVLVKITGSRPDSRAALETIRAGLAAQTPVPDVVECEKCNGHGMTHFPDGECEGKCPICKGVGIVQPAAQGEPVAADAEDAARLDWLESMGNEPEGILLHDGGDFTGRRGLGLRRIGRTIRAAIDAARKAGT